MASKFEAVTFDGTQNFGLWQTRVKDLLAQQGISRTLSNNKLVKVDDDKWEELHVQVCATTRLCLSNQFMSHFMEETSLKIWDNWPISLCQRWWLKSCIRSTSCLASRYRRG